jgi:hypothetical protein
MRRDGLRRGLAWGLVATLLMPVMVAVVLGLGGLLAAVGDAGGALACSRLGIVLGALWITAVVATVAVNAAATHVAPPPRPPAGRPRRRRRRMNPLAAERLGGDRAGRERPPA